MASLNAVLNLFDSWSGKLDEITKKTDGVINAFQKGMKTVDEFTNLNTKLGLITGNLKEQAELQDKIFASANRSRGSYIDMANTIAKLGSTTNGLFESTGESVQFTELIQKSMAISGTSKEDQPMVLQQMTDSMVNGKMDSSALLSIADSASFIYDAISGYTKKSGDELLAMADKGELTSELLKNAMFTMKDNIEQQFSNTPITFADIWNQISNAGIEAFTGLMTNLNSLLNNQNVINFINGIINVIYLIGNTIDYIVNLITQYWPVIQSILIAIGIFLLVNVIGYLTAAIPVLINYIAWWLLANAPLIMLIATIAAVIYMLQSMGITFEDIFGFIGGLVGSVIAFILNVFIMLWNFIADFLNFLGNAFNHPLLSILIMFNEWSINILDFILGIAKGIEELINKIPGVEIDLTSKLTNFKDKLGIEIDSLKSAADWKEFAPKLDQVDYSKFAGEGSNIGKDIYGKLEGVLKGLTEPLTNDDDDNKEKDYYDASGFGTENDPIPIEGTGQNGAVSVEMQDEDLSYLREIAERDYIANIASNSLSPNISIQFGDVHENADANMIAGRIKKILQEEIAMASEGVY